MSPESKLTQPLRVLRVPSVVRRVQGPMRPTRGKSKRSWCYNRYPHLAEAGTFYVRFASSGWIEPLTLCFSCALAAGWIRKDGRVKAKYRAGLG